MGNKYEWDKNPVEDFLVLTLAEGVDISKKDNVEEIKKYLKTFFENLLKNPNDLVHLNFNIKKSKGNYYKVIANNLLTALWLKGILPNNTNRVLIENKLIYNNLKYTFNQKTKELKIQKLK